MASRFLPSDSDSCRYPYHDRSNCPMYHSTGSTYALTPIYCTYCRVLNFRRPLCGSECVDAVPRSVRYSAWCRCQRALSGSSFGTFDPMLRPETGGTVGAL
uniref:Uncharacterized protein n=1 Tax=Cacopsylla melanoneura TaxID=428564 RepID=A0A8D8TH77_9HEMI